MRLIILSVVITGSHPVVAAELSGTEVNETRRDASSTAAGMLSATDVAHARLWDLSETEWHRYQLLMQGVRGSISPPTISPVEVLGIHARDDAERQRYAEAWVHVMRDDVDRILAFQHAYDAAGKRLYPNEPLIDIDRLPGKTESMGLFRLTDRLLFFARPACPVCDTMMTRLLSRIDDVRGIDIYLTDLQPGDDAAVRAWASKHHIDPEWVRSRRITLNHDGGALAELTSGRGAVPHVLRRRGADLSPLQISDL